MFTLELLFLELSENTVLRLDTALGLDWAQPVVVGPQAPEVDPSACSCLAPTGGLCAARLFSSFLHFCRAEGRARDPP